MALEITRTEAPCLRGSPQRSKIASGPNRELPNRETQGNSPMAAQAQLFLCLKDNFGVLVHDPATGATAAMDAPEARPVEAALEAAGWRLTDILVTHHHHDHTGGIE